MLRSAESAGKERLSDSVDLVTPVHLALQSLLVSLLHSKHSPKYKTGWQSPRANFPIRCYTALVRCYKSHHASACSAMYCPFCSLHPALLSISHTGQPRRICMSFAFTLICAAALPAFSTCSQHICILSMFRSFFSCLY